MLAVMVLMCVPALVRGKLSRVQGVLLLCIYAGVLRHPVHHVSWG